MKRSRPLSGPAPFAAADRYDSAVDDVGSVAPAHDAVRERELVDLRSELAVARRDVRLETSAGGRGRGVDPLPAAALLLLDDDRDERVDKRSFRP